MFRSFLIACGLLCAGIFAGAQEESPLAPQLLLAPQGQTLVRGSIIDSESGKPIAARVMWWNEKGEPLFVLTTDAQAKAYPYNRTFGGVGSPIREQHTTVSAHSFSVVVPPGLYNLRIEKGKEYLPLHRQLQVVGQKDPMLLELPLRRWSRVSEQGWYSGETHVHRSLVELPTLMQAEDLNVTFPLVHWVKEAGQFPPTVSREGFSEPFQVSPDHFIFPGNTEYEIFKVGEKTHTLGAFFALNHRRPLSLGVPPVEPVGRQVRAEGGLIEMDKHSWEWSMSLVPILKPDLYELANNHMWRTDFGFRKWGVPPPAYMNIPHTGTAEEPELSEWGWIQYGFENYYTLLNCGLRIAPTAGTASGVHPVPLGFNRVYVRMKEGVRFQPAQWLEGLRAGRSFVTTGPMLFAEWDDEDPGTVFVTKDRAWKGKLRARVESLLPIQRVQVIYNGKILREFSGGTELEEGVHRGQWSEKLQAEESGWLIVRALVQEPDGRIRFAHTAPWYVEIKGKPLRPRREEVEFLVARVAAERRRNEGILSPEAMAELSVAQKFYESKLQGAR